MPQFPESNADDIAYKLKVLKKIEKTLDKKIFEFAFRNIFIKNNLNFFGDFVKYLSFIDDIPLFNVDSYLATRNYIDKDFFNELSGTQIFRQFLQYDCKEKFSYFYELTTSFNIAAVNRNLAARKSFKRSNSITNEKRGRTPNKSDLIENKQEQDEQINNTAYIVLATADKPKLDAFKYMEETDYSIKSESQRIYENIIDYENIVPEASLTMNYVKYLLPEEKTSKLQSPESIKKLANFHKNANINISTLNSVNLQKFEKTEQFNSNKNDLEMQYKERRKVTIISRAKHKKEEEL